MIRILIVEDEKPISNLIEMSLGNAGYECECVYDGMTAADRIEKGQYDLILLDIMLVMNSWSTYGRSGFR